MTLGKPSVCRAQGPEVWQLKFVPAPTVQCHPPRRGVSVPLGWWLPGKTVQVVSPTIITVGEGGWLGKQYKPDLDLRTPTHF